ncbi:MAG: prepilin-type N-terminal cleavage/methylation domain-containing protein [Deltaproteobacteria bacterium]|nr:prepilin-type N-terminal cleavage/methylation domain-containing protein [Deltaproteobacteria bacterium]
MLYVKVLNKRCNAGGRTFCDAINNKGFTLVELMVALVIFAVGILAVGQLQVTSIRYNSHAQRMSEATMLAQSQMEELMSIDYDTVAAETATTGSYLIKWQVDDDPVAEIKDIAVTVSWDCRGVDKNVSLNCLRSKLD